MTNADVAEPFDGSSGSRHAAPADGFRGSRPAPADGSRTSRHAAPADGSRTSRHAAPTDPVWLHRRQALTLAALSCLPGSVACGTPPPGGAARGVGAAAPPPAVIPSASGTARAKLGTPHSSRAGGSVPFRPGRVMLGAYLDLQGLSLGESVALRRRQLGRDGRILHRFYAWRDDLPRFEPAMPSGSTLMISWRGAPYEQITGGSADRVIATAAQRLAEKGEPILLRWGWEMNGDWYEWGGARNHRDADAYVQAWRRLHRIFREEGADNVSWVWSPNWNSNPDEPWNRLARYYPGDAYVDWAGVSGYNLARQPPQELFGGFYAEFADRKPMMISEVGAVDRGGRTKADWITQFAAWVEAHPSVGAVVWFDTDTHPGYPERWRIDTDAESLAAYVALAKSRRFSG